MFFVSNSRSGRDDIDDRDLPIIKEKFCPNNNPNEREREREWVG
jgi:hypothetical protein